MISIRPATTLDIDTLLEFEQAIVAYERPFDSRLKESQIHYYDLRELVSSEKALVLVAVDNQEIVGSGYAKIIKGKSYEKNELQGYLGFMYVKPAFRRKGVNKKILTGLMEWVRTQGLKEVRLHVYKENEAAVEAYEKAGFASSLVEMSKNVE